MRFTVPQFIEREAKIVGPFTFRQFTFVGIAGATAFVLRYTVSFPIFLILTIFLAAGSLSLAFIKISGRPLPVIIANFFKYLIAPKVYIWKQRNQPEIKK